jgi:hypothetical protein
MTDTRQEVSDKLRLDKNRVARARNDIDSAIAWIQGLEIIDPPKRFVADLQNTRDLLDWYSRFLTNDVLNPQSIYIHNILNPGVIDI